MQWIYFRAGAGAGLGLGRTSPSSSRHFWLLQPEDAKHANSYLLFNIPAETPWLCTMLRFCLALEPKAALNLQRLVEETCRKKLELFKNDQINVLSLLP